MPNNNILKKYRTQSGKKDPIISKKQWLSHPKSLGYEKKIDSVNLLWEKSSNLKIDLVNHLVLS
jgi:hypothetical protein